MPAYKNKDNGTWYVMTQYTNWKGERKPKCKRGFDTKREAQEWEHTFRQQNSGDLDMPFSAFVEIYCREQKPRLKESTWQTKENIIQQKILPYFENYKIDEITTKDVRAWQNDTLKRVRETGGADYSYSSDYDIVARLKALADSYKVTMLIVHHTRKEKAEDIFDMISGTNGLLGAADGAFALTKEKRTSNNATLDIVGRDQPDMKIKLVRDTKRLVWNFEEAETELWEEPPDPLLEKISEVVSSGGNCWNGTASELCEKLGSDMKPNVLSLKLSINSGRLLRDYGIHYKASRTHGGRKISLWKDTDSVTMCDDRDKLSENDDEVENIVTTVTV